MKNAPETGPLRTDMDIRFLKNSKTIEQSRKKLADVFTSIPKASLLPVKIIRTGTEDISRKISKAATDTSQAISETATKTTRTITKTATETIPRTITKMATDTSQAITRTATETIPRTITKMATDTTQAIAKTATETIPRTITKMATDTTQAITKTATETIPGVITRTKTAVIPRAKNVSDTNALTQTTVRESAETLPAVNNTATTPAENDTAELDMIDISNKGIPLEIREKLKLRKVREERRQLIKTKFKKKLAKGSAGTVLGLSIMLAGLFDSPADLIQQQTINNLNNTEAIVIMVDEDDIGSDEDERKQTETVPTGRGLPRRIADAVRNFIRGLPQWIRMCICVPLWGAGYGIIHLLSLLYTAVLSPVLSHVIGFALMAAALLAAFAVTMKCIFPDMPLKKILKRRNITIVLIGTLILKVLDILLPVFWAEYFRYKYLIMIISGIALLLVTINAIRRRKNRKYRRRHISYIADHQQGPLADEEE